MKTNTLALTLTLSIGLLAPLAAQLEIKDTKGKHLDILSGDKVLVRYMYEYDTSTDEKKHATYKPYLHVFDAGTYTVSCDVHPAMGAYIVVTEAPYAAVADREGRFELLSIPAGRHTVRVWNIDAGRRSERVVDIVGTAEIDLTVPE